MNGLRSALTAVLMAAGFLLLQLGWILSLPPATGIDEFDHIHRAASVAAGHWTFSDRTPDRKAGRGGLVPVPKDVVAASRPGCETFKYVGPANCSAYGASKGDLVLIASAAARYNPTFYILAGYPSRLFQGTAALTVMRVAAAVLSTVMLALAVVAIRTWARTGWPVLGLVLAATPTVIYSSSIATPNGLNITAGLALWSALLGLLYVSSQESARRRLLLAIAAVSAVVLVNTHTLGLLWLALIVTAVAIQRGSLRLPRVTGPDRRWAWGALSATTVGVAFAMTWVLVARTNNPVADGILTHQPWWKHTFAVGLPLWPLQAIAAFPMRDEMAPLAVYAIGLTLMCSLAAVACVTLFQRRQLGSLRAIVFVAVLSYAVPIALTAVSFRYIGLAWQGRYEMPFTGGLLLLFAVALDRPGVRLPVPVMLAATTGVAVMNVLGQLRVTHQFQDSALLHATGWHLPSATWLTVLAVGYAACGALALHRTQQDRVA